MAELLMAGEKYDKAVNELRATREASKRMHKELLRANEDLRDARSLGAELMAEAAVCYLLSLPCREYST